MHLQFIFSGVNNMKFSLSWLQNLICFFSNSISQSKIKSFEDSTYNELFYGKGRLEFKDGSVYEGEFENNKMHGYGKIFFKDGSIYQGNFKNNLRDGTGISRSKDGSQQRVVYQKGKFKEVYTEDYTFYWKNIVEGAFEVRAANSTEAAEIFHSLSKEDLLNKSKLSVDIRKLKVTDVSVFVEEGTA